MTKEKNTRTRYAPSPTGYMHIGNLRTALYEYLIAKSNGGTFVLRIEDTDKERYVDGATDIIYSTLKLVGLTHDEGPDIGGQYAPYVQSERLNFYKKYALELIEKDKAYYCFCSKDRLELLKTENSSENRQFSGYDRHCRDLPKEKISQNLKNNVPYVIRQKVPLDGETTFFDSVYGEITVKNSEIEDQILIKADGYPTYNFANVVDDHDMNITHVVRGSEYLSSTPKYNLLYEAFGWELPTYVHLPLIMGKDPDGTISKLSKRHGATSFEDLVTDGYLPEAIVNYIALLGWCPKDNRELFGINDLIDAFSIDRIVKSPAVFDYDKLNWFNSEYIRAKSPEDWEKITTPYLKKALKNRPFDYSKIAAILKQRVTVLNQISNMVSFLNDLPDYDRELFVNKKNKTTVEISASILGCVIDVLKDLPSWDHDTLYGCLTEIATNLGVKTGTVMWPTRIAVSGMAVTPGGAVEILEILGKEEALKRLEIGYKLCDDNL